MLDWIISKTAPKGSGALIPWMRRMNEAARCPHGRDTLGARAQKARLRDDRAGAVPGWKAEYSPLVPATDRSRCSHVVKSCMARL
ncbi:hypothetical protein PtB15_6B280 [Puccinia triticina]|nr:hypothetical protein PtB15_6B280 [Puccinia triticina]